MAAKLARELLGATLDTDRLGDGLVSQRRACDGCEVRLQLPIRCVFKRTLGYTCQEVIHV